MQNAALRVATELGLLSKLAAAQGDNFAEPLDPTQLAGVTTLEHAKARGSCCPSVGIDEELEIDGEHTDGDLACARSSPIIGDPQLIGELWWSTPALSMLLANIHDSQLACCAYSLQWGSVMR